LISGARSVVWFNAPACHAGDRGFKSLRARFFADEDDGISTMIINSFPSITPFLLLAGFINILMGMLVFARGRKRPVNIIFSLICVFLCSWCLSLGFVSSNFPMAMRMAALRLTFLSVVPLPFLILLIGLVFPQKKYPLSLIKTVVLAVPPLIFSWFVSQEFVFQISVVDGNIFLNLGALNNLYTIYFMVYLVAAIIIMIRGYIFSSSWEKIGYRYFLVGIIVTILIADIFNLILVHLFNNSRFVYFGPLSTVFLVSLTSYAVLKYRLMDISLIIKKTVVYSSLTALFTGILLSFVYLGGVFFGNYVTYSAIWATVPAIFIISLLFQPLRDRVQAMIDRLFFKGKYDYRHVLRELSVSASSTIGLKPLLFVTSATIAKTLKPEKVSFFLLDRQNDDYLRKYSA
jgi:hypothetical protein